MAKYFDEQKFNNFNNLFGKYLRAVRKSKKLPLEFVASYIGISRSSLSKYEKDIGNTPITILIKLVLLYDIDLDLIKERFDKRNM